MSRSASRVGWVVAFGVVALVACSSTGSNELTDDTGGSGGGGTDGPNGNGSGNGSNGQSGPSGLPCEVDKVMKERCQSCHGTSPQYGAPESLVTYDDFHATRSGKTLAALVHDRIHDDRNPMPPPPAPRLTQDETKVLDDWIAKGAKRSTESCGGTTDPTPSDPAAPGPLGCNADVVIKAQSKYAMPLGLTDQYVCVGFDVRTDQKRHVTALGALIDNKKILHHILLFQAPDSVDPTPTACASFGSVAWKLIAGWAPGADNFILPPAAGFPEEKGTTHWVLQLHYNNAQGLKDQTDQSGYQLCTTDKLRPNDAGLVGFGSMNFKIPPRSKSTVTCDYTLPPSFQGAKLLRSWPHMHTIGSAMKTVRFKGGKGSPEVITDDPNFSFQSQLSYPANATLASGDVLRTSCTWNNTTDATVSFGERTGDEMCFNFLTYYPAIKDVTIPVVGVPAFQWTTPAQAAKCN